MNETEVIKSAKKIMIRTGIGLAIAIGAYYYFFGPPAKAREAEQRASYQEKKQKRIEKVEAEVAEGPKITSHATSYGEVMVVKVPVANDRKTWVDYHECVVWRDTELRRVSLSCPSQVDPHEIISE